MKYCFKQFHLQLHALPHMPILGSSNSAAENIVGKEEIALYEQFLLFPQCFQKLSVVDASKCVFMELRLSLYQTTITGFRCD